MYFTWCVMKLHLFHKAQIYISAALRLQSATDYGPYIQNLATPLHTTTLLEACTQLLVDQWSFLRANV